MKVLILAGGRGRRLGDMSQAINKCMLRVAGRPLIEYSLECAYQAGFREIDILVGYKAEEIMATYGSSFRSVPIRYIRQEEQKGVVHAIECARETINGADFMLMLGDELLVKPFHKKMITYFKTHKEVFGLCGMVRVKDRALISKTYAVIKNQRGEVIRLIEKPEHPVDHWMGTGNILLKNGIFNYIAKTSINSKRGEKELPDLIQCAVDDRKIIKVFNVCQRYVNVNSAEELKIASSCFGHA